MQDIVRAPRLSAVAAAPRILADATMHAQCVHDVRKQRCVKRNAAQVVTVRIAKTFAFPICFVGVKPRLWFAHSSHIVEMMDEDARLQYCNKRHRRRLKGALEQWKRCRIPSTPRAANDRHVPWRERFYRLVWPSGYCSLESPCPKPSTRCGDFSGPG